VGQAAERQHERGEEGDIGAAVGFGVGGILKA
jgi:hypothetical protein